MNKHVLAAALGLNESIALSRVEPFHGSCGHRRLLAFCARSVYAHIARHRRSEFWKMTWELPEPGAEQGRPKTWYFSLYDRDGHGSMIFQTEHVAGDRNSKNSTHNARIIHVARIHVQ